MLGKCLINHRCHMRNLLLAAFISLCASILTGCASQRPYPKIAVPASAYSVTTSQPDSNQYGIKFLVDAEPFSHQYFDSLSKQIYDNGYTKCTKSTISTWQVTPGQTSKDDNWMVTMFTTKQRDKFVVLRVEQSGKAKEKSIQHFSIAFQGIGHGTPNLSNINEFCDLHD